jgi:hypothetical protein
MSLLIRTLFTHMTRLILSPGFGWNRYTLFWMALVLQCGMNAGAQSNGLDHFSWGPFPATLPAGQAVPAAIQARDLGNNVVSGFNGQAALSAVIGQQSPTVLITEVETVSTRRVELSNVSTNAVDLSNWRVVFYDRVSWPQPKAAFTVPAGTVCPGQGVFQVRDGGIPPGAYPLFNLGFTLGWTSFPMGNMQAVLVLDASGAVVDFFCAVDGYAASIVVPTVVVDSNWSGPPVAYNNNSALTYQRTGHADRNNAADWILAANSFGFLNASLQTPFAGLPPATPVQPSIARFTNGLWSGSVTITNAAAREVLRADDGSGRVGESTPFSVPGLAMLTLEGPQEAFKAAPGLLGEGAVTLAQPLTTNITITLTSSRTNLITLPAAVTVLAGATHAMFSVTNLDDGLLEGPRIALIQASAPAFAAAQLSITNVDRPGAVLSCSAAASVQESGGWSAGAVVRCSAAPANDVAVRLSSNNTNKIQTPDFVILPAGQTSATFGFAIMDNLIRDGNVPVTIQASVKGWTTGQVQVTVIDNEALNTNLSLSLPSPVNEASGVLTNAGTVQIFSTFPTNVTVALSNSAPSRLQVPSTVTIPAGQTSVQFDVMAPDEALADGNQTVQVVATGDGFASASRNVIVVDNEFASFGIPALPAAQLAGQPFALSVYVYNSSATYLPGILPAVSVFASNSLGSFGISPSTIGPFTNGYWSGTVTLSGQGKDVSLIVADGHGHTGSSTTFEVMAGNFVNLPISDIVFDNLRGRLWAGVQTGAGSNSQSIVAIDPATGVIGQRIGLIPVRRRGFFSRTFSANDAHLKMLYEYLLWGLLLARAQGEMLEASRTALSARVIVFHSIVLSFSLGWD